MSLSGTICSSLSVCFPISLSVDSELFISCKTVLSLESCFHNLLVDHPKHLHDAALAIATAHAAPFFVPEAQSGVYAPTSSSPVACVSPGHNIFDPAQGSSNHKDDGTHDRAVFDDLTHVFVTHPHCLDDTTSRS